MRIVHVVALALLVTPGLGRAAPAADLVPTQLPRGVRPLHYDVALVPDAQALRFAGRVTATIEVGAPTRSLTLNAVDLAFESVRLTSIGAHRAVAPLKIDVDAAAQTATFTFARAIRPGRHRLSMRYTGVVATQAIGLFAIDYDTPRGRRRALYTQLENSYARRLFPSWDEPAYKASFSLEATVPAAQATVSNMPATTTSAAGPGLRRVRFATTPTMSSYLLFFAAGDFERVTTRAGATEIGVVTRRGVSTQARFALESTRDILKAYDDYFAVPYPLPKLDNVASPGASQTFGAMENWGAIFSFERLVLIDPALSTQADRQSVFGVAAHEIAHQWFGDLVTMRWWDDVWLNEGFATWMARRTTARLHPEWDSALREVASRSQAMTSDAFETTHAIVQPIVSVDQADQVFDEISYSKSAAVITMLESYVGTDVWREGVRRYLRAHAYGNTKSDDLWRAIDAASPRPVAAIARDFTRQPGVPLLRVAASRCEAGRTTLDLEQGEFSLDRPERAPRRWRLPVVARIAGHAPARTLVADGHGTLVLDGCGAVIANAGQSGYFRTSYAPAQRAALRDALAGLDPIDQLGVLDDAWALGLAGQAPLDDALELTARIPDDAVAKVWEGVLDHLLAVDKLYRADPARRAAWRRFAIGRLAPVLARLGWRAAANERAAATVLRARLIASLGELGDEATVTEARRRYERRSTEPEGYPTALRRSILAVVGARADEALWASLRAQARAETTPLVKDRLYLALADAEDETLARRALEIAVTDEPGATNGATMMRTVAERHPDMAFDFAVSHADVVARMATTGSDYFPQLASASLDPATAERLDAFAQARFPADARRPAAAAIAAIRHRAALAHDRLPDVDAWLRSRAR